MTTGIYKISYKNSDYYGSSKNIEKRWKQHIKDLEKGNHHNIYIQRIYDKHGIDVFSFEIVEECGEEDLFIIEQKYINENKGGLNLAPACGGDTLNGHPERKLIIEKIRKSILKKISLLTPEEKREKWAHPGEKNPMYGRTHSEETRAFMSGLNLGRKPKNTTPSKETKEKMSAAQKKTYEEGRVANMKGETHSEKTKKYLSEINSERSVFFNESQLKVYEVYEKCSGTSSIYFGASGIMNDYGLGSAFVSWIVNGRVFSRGKAQGFLIKSLTDEEIDELLDGSYVRRRFEILSEDEIGILKFQNPQTCS